MKNLFLVSIVLLTFMGGCACNSNTPVYEVHVDPDITCNGPMSEDLIEDFKDEVSWYCVSLKQVLSEDFMRKYKNFLYWEVVSEHQILSESFIDEFADRVDWCAIFNNQKLSPEFFVKHSNELKICIANGSVGVLREGVIQ